MDLGRVYFDTAGNECNILQLIKNEPEWAANVIQAFHDQKGGVEDNRAFLPRSLTAENGAKSALIGEFFVETEEPCHNCDGNDKCPYCYGLGHVAIKIPIPWCTIKEIYAKAVKYFGA